MFRRRSRGDEGGPRHHVRQMVSAVEAAFEFGEMARCASRLERVAAGAQCRLQVAQHRAHPVELGLFRCGAPGFGGGIEALQPVRQRMGAGGKMLSGPHFNLRFAKAFDDAELDAPRTALPNRRTAATTAACFRHRGSAGAA